MLKNRLMYLCISAAIIPGLLVSAVSADAWAVTDNAGEKSVHIGLRDVHTVTFYLPDSSDNTCLSYNSTEIGNVDNGTLLSSLAIPDTSSMLGFSFQGWYREAGLINSVNTSIPVTDDLTLYAKYTRNNVLMGENSDYYVSSSSVQTVSSSEVYKIGTQTWGTTPSKNAGDKVDLITESGKYVFTYGGSVWTMKRVVPINLSNEVLYNNPDPWTYSGCAVRPWFCGGPSESDDMWGDVLSFDGSGNSEIRIDVKYSKFTLARLDKNNQTWGGKWQQAKDVDFTKDDYGNPARRYTSSSPRCYFWRSSNNSNDSLNFSWGAE